MSLEKLPWSTSQIERILPHRAPFLFVDRVIALEPDVRVVGCRSWGEHEALLELPDGSRAVPEPYLTESMAQVGAVLILSKPENRGRIIYFMGIDRARLRAPVRAGETVEIEARVKRIRSRIGSLAGVARIGSRVVAEGTMTFALADPVGSRA